MNKVIVIGIDHINTLGVIRAFGENHIKSDVIVISKDNKVSVIKSKYVNNYYIIPNESQLVELLINNYSAEEYNPVIISTTDNIALTIDDNYDKLKEFFLISSVKNKSLSYYMDKYNQYKLAKSNNIRVAESIIFDLNNDKTINLNYPIILKPITSAKGVKDDITICTDLQSLKKAKQIFLDKGYKKILIQEFIEYDLECDVAGFIYENNVDISGIIKKINIWPSDRGSTTYGEVLSIDDYKEDIDLIRKMLIKTGYNGIFDIDFFIKNNKLYFNEINFRNGALSYAYGNYNICYCWYKSVISKNYNSSIKIEKPYFFIEDNSHIHNIMDGDISILKYFQHIKNSKIKLAYNSKDKKPWFLMIIYKIKNKFINKKGDQL